MVLPGLVKNLNIVGYSCIVWVWYLWLRHRQRTQTETWQSRDYDHVIATMA